MVILNRWDGSFNTLDELSSRICVPNKNIVIRNGNIIWKHGPNRPFFIYKLSSENY